MEKRLTLSNDSASFLKKIENDMILMIKSYYRVVCIQRK